eukprot:3632938-Prymnesium_polylepis.1
MFEIGALVTSVPLQCVRPALAEQLPLLPVRLRRLPVAVIILLVAMRLVLIVSVPHVHGCRQPTNLLAANHVRRHLNRRLEHALVAPVGRVDMLGVLGVLSITLFGA